jgi:hypothetical protein
MEHSGTETATVIGELKSFTRMTGKHQGLEGNLPALFFIGSSKRGKDMG